MALRSAVTTCVPITQYRSLDKGNDKKSRGSVGNDGRRVLGAPSPRLRRCRISRSTVRRRRDGHEFHSLSGRVNATSEPAEAARDGDALAALVFLGGVLARGDGGRRRLFQSDAVCGRATGQHSVDAGAGVSLGHVFGQSPIMRRFVLSGREGSLVCTLESPLEIALLFAGVINQCTGVPATPSLLLTRRAPIAIVRAA